jgi:hypothetical protein
MAYQLKFLNTVQNQACENLLTPAESGIMSEGSESHRDGRRPCEGVNSSMKKQYAAACLSAVTGHDRQPLTPHGF